MLKLTIGDAEGQAPVVLQKLDELAREGARRMIAAALEAEVAQYVEALRDIKLRTVEPWSLETGGRTTNEQFKWGQAASKSGRLG